MHLGNSNTLRTINVVITYPIFCCLILAKMKQQFFNSLYLNTCKE